MRIGLVTTLGINIGDEFIRDGLLHCLERAVPGEHEYICVHKHRVADVFPFERLFRQLPFADQLSRSARFAWRFERFCRTTGRRSTAFDQCDAVIQCGAPIFWPRCGDPDLWQHQVWHDALARLAQSRPVLNLAGGAAYPWTERDQLPGALTAEDLEEIRFMLDRALVTTVRDSLADEISCLAGSPCERIPCSAILSPRRHKVRERGERDFVLMNYMPLGGHYRWASDEACDTWASTVQNTVQWLQKRGDRVVFVCHNQAEQEASLAVAGSADVVRPSSRAAYMQLIRRAKAGVCNRMHAAVVLAGIGIPALAVGNDTRMLMVSEIGAPILPVEGASPDRIKEFLGSALEVQAPPWCDVAKAQAERAESRYSIILKEALGR